MLLRTVYLDGDIVGFIIDSEINGAGVIKQRMSGIWQGDLLGVLLVGVGVRRMWDGSDDKYSQ